MNTRFNGEKIGKIIAYYATSSKQLSADIGEIIIKTGNFPSYREMTSSYSGNPCYLIYPLKGTTSTYQKSRNDGLKFEKQYYEGKVYCISLPKNHVFLTRRNNKCTWQGNCYNTYIGFKIIYGNNLMEMCHKIPHADCDVIIDTLSHATDRIISPAYLRGGMADGGECHPRDNLALSWLAEQLELSSDMFSFVMETRRAQAEWLARLLASYDLPIIILGARYKPNTNLTSESASLLVEGILKKMGKDVSIYDPDIGLEVEPRAKAVYLIGHMFDFIKSMSFEGGSIVVDPWNWLGDAGEAVYISIGRS